MRVRSIVGVARTSGAPWSLSGAARAPESDSQEVRDGERVTRSDVVRLARYTTLRELHHGEEPRAARKG